MLNRRTGGYLGIENKFQDNFFTGQISKLITGAECDPAARDSLNALARGDTQSDRDGRQATMTSLYLQGFIEMLPINDSTSPYAGHVVRIMVVLDKQTNGAQLDSEKVFTLPIGGNMPNVMRNLEYVERFDVLMDKTLTINIPSSGPSAGPSSGMDVNGAIVPFKFYKKLDLTCSYQGNNAVILNQVDQSLHVIAFTNDSTCFLRYTSRVRFMG